MFYNPKETPVDYVILVIFGLGGIAFAFATRYIWVYGANNLIRAIFIPLFLFLALVVGFLISLGEFKNRPDMGEAWMRMAPQQLLSALALLAFQAWFVELAVGFLLFWLITQISSSIPDQA